MIKIAYYIKRNEEADFQELISTDNTKYSCSELGNGKLVVEITERISKTTTKVSNLSYKGKNWYKLIYATEE